MDLIGTIPHRRLPDLEVRLGYGIQPGDVSILTYRDGPGSFPLRYTLSVLPNPYNNGADLDDLAVYFAPYRHEEQDPVQWLYRGDEFRKWLVSVIEEYGGKEFNREAQVRLPAQEDMI